MRLVARQKRQVELAAATRLLGGLRPSVLMEPRGAPYGISITYTRDEDDAPFALVVTCRACLPGEAERFVADAARVVQDRLHGAAEMGHRARGEVIALHGLAGCRIDSEVEDRIERSVQLHGEGLVFEAHGTSTRAAETEAAIEVALSAILPQFLADA